MGRLNEMLGINENFKTESSKAIKNAFSLDATSKEDVDVLPLKAICPRYQNKYINDPKTTKALAKSIEKNGMLQPIVVIRIDEIIMAANISSFLGLEDTRHAFPMRFIRT